MLGTWYLRYKRASLIGAKIDRMAEGEDGGAGAGEGSGRVGEKELPHQLP